MRISHDAHDDHDDSHGGHNGRDGRDGRFCIHGHGVDLKTEEIILSQKVGLKSSSQVDFLNLTRCCSFGDYIGRI